MRRMLRFLFILIMSLASITSVFAADPEIRLQDPALEARAKKITQSLRCPTCVSQSVDSSNVGISRDLQVLVRDRIIAGDSDREILDYVAERYGDFVLLRPRMNARNAALWGLPFIVLIGVASALIFVVRRKHQNLRTRSSRPGIDHEILSQDEEEKIATILDHKKDI